MEKKLLLIFVFFLFFSAACIKKDESNPENNNTQLKCSQQSATNYDSQGNVLSQSLYFYSNGRLDSMVSISSGNRNVFRYNYLTDRERKVTLYLNNQKQENYTMQYLDKYGNVIESYSIQNGQKGVVTKSIYNCN